MCSQRVSDARLPSPPPFASVACPLAWLLQAANEALAKAQAEKAALAEECAALKGRVTALEEQLAAVNAASSTTEQMRAR